MTKNMFLKCSLPSKYAHMGHVRNYVIGDISMGIMLKGDEVIIQWDGTRLDFLQKMQPYSTQTHPRDWTYKNIENMKDQLQKLDLDLDWDRELATCMPDYYKYQRNILGL